ncbi:MAG TPA: hypothetical protein VKH37_05720, partial [Ferruginibacter sp.]|nr:hypothetical protein [Ferruginibacter sp.]
SSLSFVERAAVKVFYGGLPPSSFKEAIAAFEKSEALTPGFCLNYFELARAYQKNGDHQKAIDTLSKLATLPNRTEDDTQIKTDGKKMLMMLQQLRN